MSTPAAPLAGRRAVVTGASRGIGRAVAVALAQAGATVLCVARGRAALDEAAAAAGPGAVAVPGDVATAEGVAALVAAIHAVTGGAAPDLLVNNAGLFAIAALHETEPAAFDAAVQVNLVAPFRLVHAFLGAMRTRGSGHVITLGTVADRHIFPGNGAYSATKYGARALHEVLRAETRGTGVRATLVSPGPVDTPIWDPIDPDHRPGFPPRAAMLRAEDVAAAVLYAATQPAHVTVEELRLSFS